MIELEMLLFGRRWLIFLLKVEMSPNRVVLILAVPTDDVQLSPIFWFPSVSPDNTDFFR